MPDSLRRTSDFAANQKMPNCFAPPYLLDYNIPAGMCHNALNLSHLITREFQIIQNIPNEVRLGS